MTGWRFYTFKLALVVTIAPLSAGAQGTNGVNPRAPKELKGPSTAPPLSSALIVSGAVRIEDRQRLPRPATVTRTCRGGSWSGFTDANGGYSFRAMNELGECEVRATLAGFYQVSDPGPNGGLIVLARSANFEESVDPVEALHDTTVSIVSLQAPAEARQLLYKARDLIRRNKPAEARRELDKAVGLYPVYPAAWFELGRLFEREQKPDEARAQYLKAIASDARCASPLRRVAALDFDSQNWREVVNTTELILRLDPTSYLDAYYFQAVANYRMKNLGVAEQSARKGLGLDGGRSMPIFAHVLAMILLDEGDFAGSAEQLREFLRVAWLERDKQLIGLARRQLAKLEQAAGAPAKQNGNTTKFL